jgi:hypothetical protein
MGRGEGEPFPGQRAPGENTPTSWDRPSRGSGSSSSDDDDNESAYDESSDDDDDE